MNAIDRSKISVGSGGLVTFSSACRSVIFHFLFSFFCSFVFSFAFERRRFRDEPLETSCYLNRINDWAKHNGSRRIKQVKSKETCFYISACFVSTLFFFFYFNITFLSTNVFYINFHCMFWIFVRFTSYVPFISPFLLSCSFLFFFFFKQVRWISVCNLHEQFLVLSSFLFTLDNTFLGWSNLFFPFYFNAAIFLFRNGNTLDEITLYTRIDRSTNPTTQLSHNRFAILWRALNFTLKFYSRTLTFLSKSNSGSGRNNCRQFDRSTDRRIDCPLKTKRKKAKKK